MAGAVRRGNEPERTGIQNYSSERSGDPDTVKRKLDVLRAHCEKENRNFDEIERTNLTSVLIARDEPALQRKKQALGIVEPFRGNALTVSQAVDLVGRYQDIGVQMFITSAVKNDRETLELLAGDVMPKYSEAR